MEAYFQKVQALLQTVRQTQGEAILEAASRCTEVILARKRLFFFGTGHSHMLAEEPFYRAGGLIPVVPILEPSLMLHEGAVKSTRMERLGGIAEILLDRHEAGAGDAIFIISNSGLNAVPVEMAIGAKRRGLTVVALTNIAQSQSSEPRHESKQRLFELADLVLDNCGPHGDAAISLEPYPIAVGPTSTVVGAFIINAIVVQIADNFRRLGEQPPLFMSANVAGGDEHNKKWIEALREGGYRIPL
ncbi:SIS domain-containing protein [Paenibacillus silvisoli]|uniref:SIS domain-containing protein n=1 Tax=Paenibacillus silvisoli TaxID=3110539 RepID=UPI002805AAC3|nr:SIS domain-containing protein [Paenibacillus silvisoli]